MVFVVDLRRFISVNMVSFFCEDVSFSLRHRWRIALWLCRVCKMHSRKLGRVNVIFCSDSYLLKINQKFLGHDYYTDVITFDYSEGSDVSGDVFVSVDSVRKNAEIFNQTFDRELHRVIVHGILHILGFDDATETQISTMRCLEDEALLLLKKRFFVD